MHLLVKVVCVCFKPNLTLLNSAFAHMVYYVLQDLTIISDYILTLYESVGFSWSF